jgi:hypothetical protein
LRALWLSLKINLTVRDKKESIVRFRTSSEFWLTAKNDWIGIVLQTVEQRGFRWNEEGNEEMSQ